MFKGKDKDKGKAKAPKIPKQNRPGHTHNTNGSRVYSGEITIGTKRYKVWKVHCTCGTYVENATKEIT